MTENIFSPGQVQSRPLSIKVIGVGTAGSTMLESMARTDLGTLKLCAIHSNSRMLEASSCSERVLVGARRLRGIGTGGDPELGKIVAEEEAARLKSLFAETDLVFLVTGLGGGTGTGVAPILSRIARESGSLVLALVTLPFEFEGSRRNRQALQGLQALKGSADVVVCLPNEKVRQLIDETQSILKGFEITRDMLVQTARAVWQMLTQPALIHIDFSYLYAVLRKRQSESCVAVVESSGEKRSQSVIDQLMSSPWLDQGRALREADSVLVTLVGGPEMSIAEVNSIMDWLNRTVEKPQVIMGAAIHPEYAGKIRATIIASRHNRALPVEEPQSAPSSVEPRGELAGIDSALFTPPEIVRPASRFVAPAPDLPPEKAHELMVKQSGRKRRPPRFRQEQLPLEIVSKGRFEKSHPTIYHGEDLDVPTYIRRGIPLN